MIKVVVIVPVWLIGFTVHASEPSYVAQVTEGPPMPFGVAAHAGGNVRGVPVVTGGSSWSQDKTTKQWHRETLLFVDGKWKQGLMLPSPRSDLAYASNDTGLYVAGGTDGKLATREVLRLCEVGSDATWQRLTDFPEPIQSASGAILGGKLYVAGGFSHDKASQRLWALDTSRTNAQWKECAPLPAKGRGYVALVAHDNSLYLFGGYAGPPYQTETEVFGDAYRYDPAADRWERLKGFDLPGFGWSAVSDDDAHILLAGRIDERNQITDGIWLVDPQAPKPVAIGRLVIQSCCVSPIRVAPNTWWFIGGEPDVQKSRTPRISAVHLAKTPHKP